MIDQIYPRYTLIARYGDGKNEWQILSIDNAEQSFLAQGRVVWRWPICKDEDTGEHSWPADMRAEYERLLGRPEFVDIPEPAEPNLVELVSDEDDCAWDQKCRHGYRVEHHAVYCHNDRWLYAPRKCRRGEWLAQVYGGQPSEYAHERCPGFAANPLYKAGGDA